MQHATWDPGFPRFDFSPLSERWVIVYDLRVHNFSPHGMTRFLHLTDNGRKVMHPSVAALCLPQYGGYTYEINFGHDSMVVELVSLFSPSWQLMAQ